MFVVMIMGALTVDKSVEDELAVLLHQVVDVSENTTVDWCH